MSGASWWTGHQAGNGGTAGSGGTIKVSSTAKIYAFNGNMYTDGTDYENGKNEAVIYFQNGIDIERGYTKKSSEGTVNDSSTNYAIFYQTNEQAEVDKTGYINTYFSENSIEQTVTLNALLTDVDLCYQGVGSGAGYIEVSNGTYTVYDSMN